MTNFTMVSILCVFAMGGFVSGLPSLTTTGTILSTDGELVQSNLTEKTTASMELNIKTTIANESIYQTTLDSATTGLINSTNSDSVTNGLISNTTNSNDSINQTTLDSATPELGNTTNSNDSINQTTLDSATPELGNTTNSNDLINQTTLDSATPELGNTTSSNDSINQTSIEIVTLTIQPNQTSNDSAPDIPTTQLPESAGNETSVQQSITTQEQLTSEKTSFNTTIGISTSEQGDNSTFVVNQDLTYNATSTSNDTLTTNQLPSDENISTGSSNSSDNVSTENNQPKSTSPLPSTNKKDITQHNITDSAEIDVKMNRTIKTIVHQIRNILQCQIKTFNRALFRYRSYFTRMLFLLDRRLTNPCIPFPESEGCSQMNSSLVEEALSEKK